MARRRDRQTSAGQSRRNARQAQGGTTLKQLATESGLSVATASDLQRRKAAGFIPAKVVDDVFKTAKGSAGSAEGESQTQRFIFRVIDVIDSKVDTAAVGVKELTTSLQNSLADDIIGEYIGRLENDYGVAINQPALNQVIGGSPANQ